MPNRTIIRAPSQTYWESEQAESALWWAFSLTMKQIEETDQCNNETGRKERFLHQLSPNLSAPYLIPADTRQRPDCRLAMQYQVCFEKAQGWTDCHGPCPQANAAGCICGTCSAEQYTSSLHCSAAPFLKRWHSQMEPLEILLNNSTGDWGPMWHRTALQCLHGDTAPRANCNYTLIQISIQCTSRSVVLRKCREGKIYGKKTDRESFCRNKKLEYFNVQVIL